MKLITPQEYIDDLYDGIDFPIDRNKFELIGKLMTDYAKYYHRQQVKSVDLADVRRSVSVNIVDSDIATIEALHDLLLDAHGYSLDFITLKRARELTAKMYKAFK
jgi:hypothetical protein